MKIVVLDGFTLNPGDLSWDALKTLGACEIHDRSAEREIVPRAQGAAVALTNKTPLSRAHIEQLPDLKYIGALATGFNIIDVAAARERGIIVSNVPAYGTRSVAQMTIALLLELAHRAGDHSRGVHAGKWAACPDFCYWEHPLLELDGLTLGIVGYGRIGRAVAEIARSLGMRVIAASRQPKPPEPGVTFVPLEELFQTADVVSLHCPLTPETKHLINAERLASMKRSAFLLNTSRGPLIDEAALARALNTGHLAGAAVDVLSTEPPRENPLFGARNCIITPHIAWATRAARARLMSTAVENVRAFLQGQPQNVVT